MTDTKPTPYAWTVTGTAQMFFGDYAKHDAEQEAKRCGGTARAFPLFAAPKPLTDDQVYESIKGIDSLDALEVWRAAERRLTESHNKDDNETLSRNNAEKSQSLQRDWIHNESSPWFHNAARRNGLGNKSW